MDSKSVKKGLFLVTLVGALMISVGKAEAADKDAGQKLPGAGIESVLNDYYNQFGDTGIEQYLVPALKGEYLDMGFADVDADSYLYIRSEATKDSEWVGKLYPEGAAEIIGAVGEWTPVMSGNVSGYVKTEYLLTGHKAQAKAEELIAADTEGTGFSYAESREEEQARLEAEAAKAAEEAAVLQAAALEAAALEQAAGQTVQAQQVSSGNGQAVVDYACQFIGNPYVWGGTSLTNGADCSGFVQSVFANFGISLPRTTWDMENAGVAVSYEQAVPGDIILYDGHVGIYMGNGQIVNAIDSANGIGISSATYTNIITVRRLL